MINAGSSSVKFGVYDLMKDAMLVHGHLDRLGKGTIFSYSLYYHPKSGWGSVTEKQPTDIRNVSEAIPFIFQWIEENGFAKKQEITAIGHRIVHGGEEFSTAVPITPEVEEKIADLSILAPLHNPVGLKALRLCRKHHPVDQVAVFDTAFHQTMEPKVFRYGIPKKLYEEHKIRKYGFHGTSHKYSLATVSDWYGKIPRKFISCHLGNGSSITAIKNGQSVDNSMGFTPTDGLIMGTRSGTIDPEAVLYLFRFLKTSPAKIEEILNKRSGLQAIAGTPDVRDIWQHSQRGDNEATLALDMLAYRIAGYIGSYAAALGGIDCLSFTGGIGENAWYVRERVCASLDFLGISLQPEANQRNYHQINAGKTPVFIVKANEELQIARETAAFVKHNV